MSIGAQRPVGNSLKDTFKIIVASLLFVTPAAQAITLTFDDIGAVHGTVINTQYSGVTISAVNNDSAESGVPDLAVAFDSAIGTIGVNDTRDDDLEAPFTNRRGLGDANPGKVLIIQENDSGCGDGVCDAPDDEGSRNPGENPPGAGYFLFVFDSPIELLSIDFFDIEDDVVPPLSENGGIAGSEILFFDTAMNEVTFGTDYFVPGTGGDNTWDRLTFIGVTGIYAIQINLYGSGAIDNLAYNIVPIPASVWLFGTALLGFIGFARRRTI